MQLYLYLRVSELSVEYVILFQFIRDRLVLGSGSRKHLIEGGAGIGYSGVCITQDGEETDDGQGCQHIQELFRHIHVNKD